MLTGVDPLVFVGAVLLLLLAGLSWLTRRVQGGTLGGNSRGRVVLTNQHAVHLIELGGVRLLVGTGPSGAPRVLAQLGPNETVEAAPEEAAPGWPWLGLLRRAEVGSGR